MNTRESRRLLLDQEAWRRCHLNLRNLTANNRDAEGRLICPQCGHEAFYSVDWLLDRAESFAIVEYILPATAAAVDKVRQTGEVALVVFSQTDGKVNIMERDLDLSPVIPALHSDIERLTERLNEDD